MFVLKRNKHNPIIKPNEKNYWETHATFNWCPVKVGKITHVFYRTQSLIDPLQAQGSISVIGHAESEDGYNFEIVSWVEFYNNDQRFQDFGDIDIIEIDGELYIFGSGKGSNGISIMKRIE